MHKFCRYMASRIAKKRANQAAQAAKWLIMWICLFDLDLYLGLYLLNKWLSINEECLRINKKWLNISKKWLRINKNDENTNMANTNLAKTQNKAKAHKYCNHKISIAFQQTYTTPYLWTSSIFSLSKFLSWSVERLLLYSYMEMITSLYPDNNKWRFRNEV